MNAELEQRRHPRAPLTLPVVVMTSIGTIEGRTANLSAGGSALIFLSEKPLIDNEFQMALKIHENVEIVVTCEKVWGGGKFNIDGTMYHGFGVQFTKISSSDRQIIEKLVEDYFSD